MANQAAVLNQTLEAMGYRARMIPIQRLVDLKADIEGRHTNAQFDEDFYQERLTFFTFQPPTDFPKAQSILIVAVPRPQARLTFSLNGNQRVLISPPTYAGYEAIFNKLHSSLSQILAPQSYRLVRTRLPLKTLAVRSGLARFGRNNVTYVDGLGSFYQLVAFYTDLPSPEDNWNELQMMPRCQNCTACLKACPTQAIVNDRFLIHAERCLVFHNERDVRHPFPAWIDPAAHHCLLGCMRCQQICPENKPYLDWFEDDESFDEAETILLLLGAPLEKHAPKTVEKLERLELIDSLASIPRNLGVFFPSYEQ